MFDSVFRRKKDEEKYQKEGRLPPGQSYTQRFPVLHYGPIPPFNPQTWDFKIWGEVETPVTFTWEQFNDLPRTKVTLDLHCVTHWSKFDMLWEGITVRQLMDSGIIKPLPTARFVMQHAEHGYTANLPVDVVLQDNFLLGTHYDGQPIPADHGYPVRGVIGAIPGRNDLTVPYLWKGAKWLRGLEFLPQDKKGFWEQAGYHNEADVWKEERFA